MTRPAGALALVLALAALPAAAQQAPPLTTDNGEWPAYGGDAAHTRYSPLDQIDAANFGELEIAWRFQDRQPRPRSGVQNSKARR